MFNHGNISSLIKLTGYLLVCSYSLYIYRMHHSVLPKEINTNFGFNFPQLDHLFGTYCDELVKEYNAMVIGLKYSRKLREFQLHKLTIRPFIPLVDKQWERVASA